MDKELLAAHTLNLISGLGQKSIKILIDEYGSSSKAIAYLHEQKKHPKEVDLKLLWEQSKSQLQEATNKGLEITHYKTKQYPKRLSQIPDPPVVLFYRGNLEPLYFKRALAIVGSRMASNYGKKQLEKFLEDLAPLKPTIISGLATGIDIAAHRIGLELGLQSVAVMPGSPLDITPKEHHKEVKLLLEKGGAIVSEFGPRKKIDQGAYPQRNRIIAALCDAVFIPEARENSGTTITAKLAADYHKEVFALPGEVHKVASAGCNLLIKSNIAQLVTSASDIVDSMSWNSVAYQEKEKPVLDLGNLQPLQRNIIQALQRNHQLNLEQLMAIEGESLASIKNNLLQLELEGLVSSKPGGFYELNW